MFWIIVIYAVLLSTLTEYTMALWLVRAGKHGAVTSPPKGIG